MKRYSDEVRQEALTALKTETVAAVSARMKIGHAALSRWKKAGSVPLKRNGKKLDRMRKAVALLDSGVDRMKVAKRFDISDVTLYHWREKLKANGQAKAKSNGHEKSNGVDVKRIQEVLQDAQRWLERGEAELRRMMKADKIKGPDPVHLKLYEALAELRKLE